MIYNLRKCLGLLAFSVSPWVTNAILFYPEVLWENQNDCALASSALEPVLKQENGGMRALASLGGKSLPPSNSDFSDRLLDFFPIERLVETPSLTVERQRLILFHATRFLLVDYY